MIKEGDKLYFIVRSDLGTGLAFAQLIHAFRQFTEEHSEIEKEWFRRSNYIAVLSVETHDDLHAFLKDVHTNDVTHSLFHEPDLNNELTAIVLEPSEKSKKLCKKLPLYF